MKHHTHIQQNRNRRTLRLESLERRDLLSAVPLSASEYAALTAQYSSLSLPETMDDLNVITLDLSEGDDINSLKSAIAEAGQTTASDLIVIRTTDTANTLTVPATVTSSFDINIDVTQYGTFTVIAIGDIPLQIGATYYQSSGVFSVSTNSIANLGNIVFSQTGGGTGISVHGQLFRLLSS